jgi:hypothetical protein
VHDAALVGRGEPPRDLDRVLDGLAHVERAGREPIVQGPPLEQLGDE